MEEVDEFELIEYPPRNQFLDVSMVNESKEGNLCPFTAMSGSEFSNFFDGNGRTIMTEKIRERLFKGGVEPAIRKEVWKFLFGYFAWSSTDRERKVLSKELTFKYNALKFRWAEEISESDFKQNLSAPVQSIATVSSTDTHDAEYQCMAIQAQLFAGRQPFDMKKTLDNIRMIDKDVPRTDRGHPFYMYDEDGSNQNTLRDILITFASYHIDVGYVQGMNDIASRFLIVLQSEADAYWCFTYYMNRFKEDFLEDGMLRRLDMLRSLLSEIDGDLYNYLQEYRLQDLTFCHRWLLLNFLREFNFDDGLCLFEVICCEFLEMNSSEAERTRELCQKSTFQQDDGHIPELHIPIDIHLTFNLFVCVAVLMENRKDLFSCVCTTSVIQCMTTMPKRMTVRQIIHRAEKIFYAYCQRSVTESFQVLDPLEDDKAKRKLK